jgi:hypothetical protein
MRRKISLILITLGLLSSSSGLLAATSGTLTLSGVIDAVVSIVVNDTGAGSNMDLTLAQNDLVVATLDESSNTAAGYQIFVKSTNAGLLKHSNGAGVTYTAKYDGSMVTLAVTDQLAKSVVTGGVQSDSSDFAISYSAQDATTLEQGTYTDTVTFTIQSL